MYTFSPGPSPLKFYYIKHLCEMELLRKFKFFRFFHYKTILFSSESEFSMKNVFFWGTSCWYSSKIKKLGGALISYNCSLWAPFNFPNFWGTSAWFISKEHICHREFRFRRKKYSFLMKNSKNLSFHGSSIQHRRI